MRPSVTVLLIGILGYAAEAIAQNTSAGDSLEHITFTGSVDTYFHRSINTSETAPRTSFANLPGFSLGMINFVVGYSGRKAGAVTDVVLGPRGSDAIFNAPLYHNGRGGASSHLINQMYVYYKLTNRVTLNAGQFNTFLGYESISPVKNTHYSTSYLFSYGPFNHTGVWADLKMGEHVSGKLALMNPTDFTEFNPFDSYTVGGQLSITGEKSAVNLNATYGDPDGRLTASDSIGSSSFGRALQLDLMASFPVGDIYSIGVSSSMRNIGEGQVKIATNDNLLVKKSGYFGIALYQSLTVSQSTLIALRTEYFGEFNSGVGAIGTYNSSSNAKAFAATLSANVRSSNFRFIPELRVDNTSTGSFHNNKNLDVTRTMVTLNFAVVYTIPTFDVKVKN